jgi:hypothetical protein
MPAMSAGGVFGRRPVFGDTELRHLTLTVRGGGLWEDAGMTGWDEDPDEGRAPICPYCGVTALPAELSHVLDTDFVCDNADCDAYGDRIDP